MFWGHELRFCSTQIFKKKALRVATMSSEKLNFLYAIQLEPDSTNNQIKNL